MKMVTAMDTTTNETTTKDKSRQTTINKFFTFANQLPPSITQQNTTKQVPPLHLQLNQSVIHHYPIYDQAPS